MTRVVVTGAAGFIGRRLVRRLLDEGLEGTPASVVAIVRRAPTFPADLASRCDVRVLDLATATIARIAAACGTGAVVFHLAAEASVGGDSESFENNVRATDRLVEALRGCAPRRLVFASSIGAVDRLPSDPCTSLLDEGSPPHPLTKYGESKLAGERAVSASGLPFAIVRPTWVYGPGMRANSHLRVFAGMVQRGAAAARVHFPGRVSVIHVDDLCVALMLVAVHPHAAGQTYFASDGAPVAIGELFATLGALTGRRAGTTRVPALVTAAARRVRAALPFTVQLLNSDVLAASNDRLAGLGFVPAVPLRRGLLELVRDGRNGRGAWLVTGAGGGIGRAIAEQAHANGDRVVAVDRDETALRFLADDCPGIACHPADLVSEDGRARITALVGAIPDLRCVVNCAGVGARGTVGAIDAGAERAVIDVNVIALAAISTAAVVRFRSSETGGALVNVASSAALQPLPFMATYAASKAFVLSYSEAVAAELAGTPVCVIAACPGGTDTGFQAAAGVRRVEGERLMPPAAVAAEIMAAVHRGRSATLFIGSRTLAMSLAARLLPRRALATLWARMMGSLR